MGSTTPAPWSIPYPTGTDRVMDGDNAIQAVADRMNALFVQNIKGVPVPQTALTLQNGWAGNCFYFFRSGVVVLWYSVTKASWNANEIVATLPAAYWPYLSLYDYGAGVNNAVPIPVYMSSGDGTFRFVSATAAGSGGASGYFTFHALNTLV